MNETNTPQDIEKFKQHLETLDKDSFKESFDALKATTVEWQIRLSLDMGTADQIIRAWIGEPLLPIPQKYYNLNPSTATRCPDKTEATNWGAKGSPRYLYPRAWGFATYPDRLPFQTVQNNGLYPDNPAEALCYRAWQEYHAEAEGALEGWLYRDPGELRMIAEYENFWADMILGYEVTSKQVENIFIKENESDE